MLFVEQNYKTCDELELVKEKKYIFCKVSFVRRNLFLTSVYYLNV